MKTIGVVLIIVVAVAVLFLLGARKRSPEHLIKRVFNNISNKLDLNDAQTTLLLSARDEIIEKGREMHEERERMHKDLSRLILSDRIDVDEVKAEAKKKHDKMEDFFNVGIEKFAEFHSTLTPEQKKSLAEMLEKHTQKMKRIHP